MIEKNKKRLLFLMGGVAVLLLILASSLSNIQLLSGHPFPIEWKQVTGSEATPFGNGNWLLVLIRGFFILCAIAIPIYIFISLLTPQGRKRLVKNVAQLLVLLLVLYLLTNLADSLTKRNPQETPTPEPGQAEGQSVLPEGQIATPQPLQSTAPSPWLDVGVCLGLAFILAILITILAWGIYRASRERTGDAISRLADEAQDALDAILAGGNIRETVIRCYVQMTQVVAIERNLRREEAMTPHEFEQILLNKMKLPEVPVHRLTSLFEAVRYGDYHPGKREEMEAIDSLTAIAAACKGAKA